MRIDSLNDYLSALRRGNHKVLDEYQRYVEWEQTGDPDKPYLLSVHYPRMPAHLKKLHDFMMTPYVANAKIDSDGETVLYGSIHVAMSLEASRLVCQHGPKVVKLDADDALALHEIECSFAPQEVLLPFPVLMVHFPPLPALRANAGEGIQAVPAWVTVFHDPRINALAFVVFRLFENRLVHPTGEAHSSAVGYKTTLIGLTEKPGEPVETFLKGMSASVAAPVRIAMNALMLMQSEGVRRVGYQNESYARRLQSRIDRGVRVEENQRELAFLPDLYTFEQHVKPRSVAGDASAFDGDHPGRQVKPHWRRAHWRMQRCGPGLSQTRRTPIPHCLVHREQFKGANVNTTYVTGV